MSSSIALERNPAPSTALVNRRRSAAQPHRTGTLADRIAMHIESLVPRGRAECLDVGCGDLALAESIEEQLPRTNWRCIDVRASAPRSPDDGRWSQYGWFDGRTIPYGDGEFDVAVLCDALQRAPENAAGLLVEAARVARHVLVKDRFRTGIAEQYFTQEAFGRLVVEQGLVITALDCGLDGYLAALRRNRQFIAVLRRM